MWSKQVTVCKRIMIKLTYGVPQFIIIITFIVGVSSKNLEQVTNVEQFGLKRSPLMAGNIL